MEALGRASRVRVGFVLGHGGGVVVVFVAVVVVVVGRLVENDGGLAVMNAVDWLLRGALSGSREGLP